MNQGPVDYRTMWGQLVSELKDVLKDLAQRTVTEKDIDKIRQYQGAYIAIQGVQAQMETLLGRALTDNKT